MSTLTVLIIDREPSACRELRAKLPVGADIEIVGEAFTIRNAVECVEEHVPQIVLVGDQRDGLRGISMLSAMRRKLPKTRSVVISDVVDLKTQVNCVEAGADALLLRSAPAEEIQETIRAVASGKNLLQSLAIGNLEMMQRLVDQVRQAPDGRRPMNRFDPHLSPCLLGVLDGIVQGWTNRQISEAEGIAEQTVKHHVANLKQRLGARDRIGLVRHAVLHEWAVLQPECDQTPAEPTDGAQRDDYASLTVISQMPDVRRVPDYAKIMCVSMQCSGIYRNARRV